MPLWTFWDCLSESKRNVIREWIAGQPQGTRQHLKAALNVLLMELEQVDGPFDRACGVGQLHGPCKGLHELILKVDKIQFRVIGCYGPAQRGEFSLLAGAIEKDRVFTEPRICRTAQDRRVRIMGDRRFIVEHDYD